MKVDISAGGTLFIIAPIGINQNIDYAGTVQSSVNLHSDTAVDIAGTTAGVYVYGVSCIQTTVIHTPEVNVAATAAGGLRYSPRKTASSPSAMPKLRAS